MLNARSTLGTGKLLLHCYGQVHDMTLASGSIGTKRQLSVWTTTITDICHKLVKQSV